MSVNNLPILHTFKVTNPHTWKNATFVKNLCKSVQKRPSSLTRVFNSFLLESSVLPDWMTQNVSETDKTAYKNLRSRKVGVGQKLIAGSVLVKNRLLNVSAFALRILLLTAPSIPVVMAVAGGAGLLISVFLLHAFIPLVAIGGGLFIVLFLLSATTLYTLQKKHNAIYHPLLAPNGVYETSIVRINHNYEAYINDLIDSDTIRAKVYMGNKEYTAIDFKTTTGRSMEKEKDKQAYTAHLLTNLFAYLEKELTHESPERITELFKEAVEYFSQGARMDIQSKAAKEMGEFFKSQGYEVAGKVYFMAYNQDYKEEIRFEVRNGDLFVTLERKGVLPKSYTDKAKTYLFAGESGQGDLPYSVDFIGTYNLSKNTDDFNVTIRTNPNQEQGESSGTSGSPDSRGSDSDLSETRT